MAREDLLARTFVELADIWDDDFNQAHVSEMVVSRCIQLFATSAVGILLSSPANHLRISACSDDQMRRALLFELKIGEGPSLDCCRTGRSVVSADLSRRRRDWPRFVPVAAAAGFRSVHAVPVRVPDRIFGSLNLFGAEVGTLSAADVLAAEALAQATAFAILRERRPGHAEAGLDNVRLLRDDQLVIEQAKGVLAGRAGIRLDEAKKRIERYAHHHNLDLMAVCHQIIDGDLSLITYPETSLQRRRSGS
jgi:GAF domain-containing protein